MKFSEHFSDWLTKRNMASNATRPHAILGEMRINDGYDLQQCVYEPRHNQFFRCGLSQKTCFSVQVSTLQPMTVLAVQVIHVWKTSRLLRGFLPWNEQTSWTCLPTYLFNRPPVGNGQRSRKVEKRTGVFMVDWRTSAVTFSSKIQRNEF